jgi:hypothetical protein
MKKNLAENLPKKEPANKDAKADATTTTVVGNSITTTSGNVNSNITIDGVKIVDDLKMSGGN